MKSWLHQEDRNIFGHSDYYVFRFRMEEGQAVMDVKQRSDLSDWRRVGNLLRRIPLTSEMRILSCNYKTLDEFKTNLASLCNKGLITSNQVTQWNSKIQEIKEKSVEEWCFEALGKYCERQSSQNEEQISTIEPVCQNSQEFFTPRPIYISKSRLGRCSNQKKYS